MTENVVEERCVVVRNDEEQYSVWPAGRDVPAGWHPAGFEGPRADCLTHIDEVWTDMRPLSLRRALAAAAAGPPAEPAVEPAGPSLVSRLCEDEHRIRVVLRPEPSAARLAEAIDNNYVHVLFPDTDGGTELGVAIDPTATDRAERSSGTVLRFTGEVTLDFQRLQCTVSVDVADLTGVGTVRVAASQDSGPTGEDGRPA